jgi:hypothetical protein
MFATAAAFGDGGFFTETSDSHGIDFLYPAS